MTGAAMFDDRGRNLAGGPPLTEFDLRQWPACMVLCTDPHHWDGTTSLTVILPDAAPAFPPDALARAVSELERGAVVAVHARDDDRVRSAMAAIFGWLGGGRT